MLWSDWKPSKLICLDNVVRESLWMSSLWATITFKYTLGLKSPLSYLNYYVKDQHEALYLSLFQSQFSIAMKVWSSNHKRQPNKRIETVKKRMTNGF